MRWDDFRRSTNIEDRRGEGLSGSRMPIGRGGLGIGTIVLLGLVGWALGIDPRLLIGGAQLLNGGGASYQSPVPNSPGAGTSTSGTPSDQTGQFVAAVLGDTEDRWRDFSPCRQDVSGAQAGHVFGGDTLRLRNCPVGDGPVLLPERSARLSRCVVLPGD